MRVSRGVSLGLGVLVLLVAVVAAGFYLRPVEYFRALTSFQMRRAGVQEHWLTVNGHRIFYRMQGQESGQVVVLVHGLGGSSADWRNLMPYLVQSGFRVYVPDLPGYGRSDQPKDFSYSIADETKFVVDFMDALGLQQVDLGGHSMGGWIAQELAYAHPERVRRLMLFDSAGINELPEWDTHLFTPDNAAQLQQIDELLMPHPPQTPEFIVRDILRLSRENGWVIDRAMRSMWVDRPATDALLPELKMPVLIVWGDLDRIVPLRQGEKIHQLVPQSQMLVVQGCGHLAPVQCADRVGPKVEEFLR